MRTFNYRFDFTSVALVAGVLAASPTVQAQPLSRFYVGGSIGTFSVDADEVEGRSPAATLLAGIALSRYVDAEVELTFPTDTFTRSYTGKSVSFAPRDASREEIERLAVTTQFDKRRDIISNFSAGVVLHVPMDARLTPGLIIGVANQRARVRSATTPIHIPPGVDPLHPSVVAQATERIQNIGGLTIGGNLAIALTRNLFVVPDVRYDYGSIGDEINNAFRTNVRVVWRFQ
jgi:Outer membrane protein beta-barrel domain